MKEEEVVNPLELKPKEVKKYYKEMNVEFDLSPIKAIRSKCVDCTCGHTKEIKECVITKCPLHPFRMGKNPFSAKRDKEYTEEEREAIKIRLEDARNKRKDN